MKKPEPHVSNAAKSADSAKPKAGKKSARGFASMDPEKQRQIASQGGRAAHERGTAHRFTPEEAAEAGRKGGRAGTGPRNRTPRGGDSAQA